MSLLIYQSARKQTSTFPKLWKHSFEFYVLPADMVLLLVARLMQLQHWMTRMAMFYFIFRFYFAKTEHLKKSTPSEVSLFFFYAVEKTSSFVQTQF